jgi:riboflavin kinase/FMN adenylyltransferase
MQYIKGIENYKNEKQTAITLGKFDGLHQGHELLIKRIEQHQRCDSVDGVVFAFDMRADDALLTNREKASRLSERVKYFIDCPFDAEIANMTAESFIEDVLVNRFHAKYIVIGTDFGFGHKKRGDYKMLQAFSKIYGYQVEIVEKKKYGQREISSTYIKEELKKGNHKLANILLGYNYFEFKKKHFDNK